MEKRSLLFGEGQEGRTKKVVTELKDFLTLQGRVHGDKAHHNWALFEEKLITNLRISHMAVNEDREPQRKRSAEKPTSLMKSPPSPFKRTRQENKKK